jgi:predicted RNase H-like HicB family nuclease
VSEFQKLFTIEIEQGKSGALYARSPEVPGLLVSGRSLEVLLGNLPNALKSLIEVNEDLNTDFKSPILKNKIKHRSGPDPY